MRAICLILFAIIFVGCQEARNDSQSVDFPDVNGMINGSPFHPDSVTVQGQTLSFRQGKEAVADMEISFIVPIQAGDILEGGVWNFGGPKLRGRGPSLSISARQEILPHHKFVNPQEYSMTLTISKRTTKLIEGTIDLKVKPPENTHLVGKFSATLMKTGKEPLDAEDAPWVQGKIVMKGDWRKEDVGAGYIGKGTDGKSYSKGFEIEFTRGGREFLSTRNFTPPHTSLLNDAKDGPRFVHTRMPPGEYFIFVRRGGVLVGWRDITVQAGDQHSMDFTIDLANTGSLVVTLPDEEVEAILNEDKDQPAGFSPLKRMQLIPDGFSSSVVHPQPACDAGEVKAGEKTIEVNHVPAGKYKAVFRNLEADVEVIAGNEAAVTLIRKN